MLVDTHCHLGAEQFAADRAQVLARAWQAGVAHVVVIGESAAALETALELAAGEPRLSAAAGVHPHDAAGWTPETESWLATRLADPRVVAAGETGLDYHYDHSPREVQREVFDRQLHLARAAGKPAVIHAREADADVEAILRNHPSVTAILHSFSSGAGLLRSALAAGHYVSFSGMVTFRNWQADDLVRLVPADRLLLETDAPYLAPVPHRGRRNEPAFVRETANHVARIRGVDVEALIAETGANAWRVFGGRLSMANC
jgi:TatD DNase family protein